MTFVALSIPDWPTGAAASELPAVLLAVAPRVTLAPREHLAWLDARGLDAADLAMRARHALATLDVHVVAAGMAEIPCVAAIAAREEQERREQERRREGIHASPSPLSFSHLSCSPGGERTFLAPLPLEVLTPDLRLLNLMHGVGLACCGDLARLPREAVEVRFGRDGLAAWRFARADDPRPIFSARPRDLPTASLDWSDFSTTDVEQLVFVVHSLLKTVCDGLLATGLGAQHLTLTLALENRTTLVQPVGGARVTAQRTTWLRLMRRALERITLPDRVTGVSIQVERASAPTTQQGDLFDLGFASVLAAEQAVGQIRDLQMDAVVTMDTCGHVLRERRVQWREAAMSGEDADRESRYEFGTVAASPATPHTAALVPTLHPAVLPLSREITVLTHTRRGFDIPLQYIDNGVTSRLTECLGPHCLSGERWTDGFAREYYQGIRVDGVIVLLYRDVARDRWYLSGWWD